MPAPPLLQSVFMISGGPNLRIASFRASTRKSTSNVLEMRQAKTLRADSFRVATRYKKSRAASEGS